jgi:hypothetical protein
MTPLEWQRDLKRKGSKLLLSSIPIAMHCHHYNINLQHMLEITMGDQGIELMYRSAEEASYFMFKEYFRKYGRIKTLKSKIELACSVYQNCGLGVLHFLKIQADCGHAISPASHHVTGWLAKHGRRDTTGCHFTRGWIAGLFEVLFGRPLGTYKVVETACKMMRNDTCIFEIME